MNPEWNLVLQEKGNFLPPHTGGLCGTPGPKKLSSRGGPTTQMGGKKNGPHKEGGENPPWSCPGETPPPFGRGKRKANFKGGVLKTPPVVFNPKREKKRKLPPGVTLGRGEIKRPPGRKNPRGPQTRNPRVKYPGRGPPNPVITLPGKPPLGGRV